MSNAQLSYNLSAGYPNLDIVPKQLLSQLASSIIDAGRGLQYGGDLHGPQFVRQDIASFLTRMTGVAVQPGELAITNGSVHGIDVVCRTLTQPGDVVLVEEPSFFYAYNLLRMSNVELVGVPLRKDGVDLDALESALKTCGNRVKLFYTIPSFQNPSGICATHETREKLVNLAARYGFTILEDSAYQFLYFDEAPPPMLRCYAPDQVVTIGTFSKIIAPSLRQGWIWSSPGQIERFIQHKSDAGASTLTCEILSQFLQSGEMDNQLRAARQYYSQNCARMVTALKEHLPEWVSWSVPQGGYFIWLTLPETICTRDVRAISLKRGVDFMPGQLCFPYETADRYIRLCFAYINADMLEQAVIILSECLREFSQAVQAG
jgi:2-aminoadipate transaminase